MVDDKPTTSDVKNLLCQDPGPKKTTPEQCDHLVDVEKALAKAIEESASCISKDVGGGTIVYVVDGRSVLPRPVTIAKRSRDRVAIASGVRAGERIALRDPTIEEPK